MYQADSGSLVGKLLYLCPALSYDYYAIISMSCVVSLCGKANVPAMKIDNFWVSE